MNTTVKFGSYLIIPLKYDGDASAVASSLPLQPMTTMDLNENVKAMFNGTGDVSVARCCRVEAELIRRTVSEGVPGVLTAGEGGFPFDFCTSFLYIFRTQVAFLCLGITYDRIEALSDLCTPGFANGEAVVTLDGRPISMEGRLVRLCSSWGLRKFFDGPATLLLDAFVHTVALLPDYFPTLEELRRVTFRLHQMVPLEQDMEDTAEEDIRYVYAVKDPAYSAYRWGCCVSSQMLCYAVADAQLDLPAEMAAQAADALPILALALYQKYTCLRFTELIATREKGRAKQLRQLKRMMLEFRAFGTVTPANLSRWHNVKQIYANLLLLSDVSTALEDVTTKLSILTDEQETQEAERSARVINIITVFGIVSILASVLSIIQILIGGDLIFWLTTVLTTLVLFAVLGLAMHRS